MQIRDFEPMDTTWRDGLQSPLWNDFKRFYPTSEEVVELVEAQMRYGVRFFEMFSPVVSERAARDLKLVIEAKKEIEKELGHKIFVQAHCRVSEEDVTKALEAGVDGLNLYMGVSPISLSAKHKQQVLLQDVAVSARKLIEQIRKTHPKLLIRFSGEDAFRTDIWDLFKVYDELYELVDVFGTPDTVGFATPKTVLERVTKLRERYPKVELEGHFQNDRGLALVNAMTAVGAGMKFIDTTILGFAERSGLPSLTSLIFNLECDEPEVVTGFDLGSSYALNVLLADIMQMLVPTTEVISATNRTHSAGVHTSAVLRNKETYEAHNLERFGVSKTTLLLGPLSGRHVIHYYLENFLNYTNISPEELLEIVREFKNKAANIKKGSGLTPEQILKELAKGHRLLRLEEPETHSELV